MLTTPKNQVRHRKKSRELSKKNRNQCQQVLKLSGSQGSLKNRSSLRRVRERVKWLLLMFVILSTLMIPNLPETEQPPPEVLGPPPALVWQQSTVVALPKSKLKQKPRLY